jgi:lysophospholipase L1-like esterase
VLAFGDSITNAGGELQWGVALHSWALWLARALGLPFTSYAFDGARARDVVERQIPSFVQLTADRDARYDIGCVYIGVNDVRAYDWDRQQYERDLGRALAFVAGRCDRTLTMTAPTDLGRPRAGAKVMELNAIVERLAREHGALVVDLCDFGARNRVMADHVHPTAFGQIEIAERALAVLTRDGLQAKVQPSQLIYYETTPIGRLRGDLIYTYRHAKVTARELWARAAHALMQP